jgi:hypothetical protein
MICSKCGHQNKGGYTKHPLYTTWVGMISRCSSDKNISYQYYGGKGVKVCERWLSFDNFVNDMGERPKGYSLDRIDSNGNYEPSNCRWATPTQQRANQSNTNKNVGVYFSNLHKKWVAQQRLNGKYIFYKRFKTEEEAIIFNRENRLA